MASKDNPLRKLRRVESRYQLNLNEKSKVKPKIWDDYITRLKETEIPQRLGHEISKSNIPVKESPEGLINAVVLVTTPLELADIMVHFSNSTHCDKQEMIRVISSMGQ